MSFSLQESEYAKIRDLFMDCPDLLTRDFQRRIKQSIKVLHFAYLWGACKEAKIILQKDSQATNANLFTLIMKLYTKRRKAHQANFLLLHCFENALRSTLAVCIANLYNTSCDDWFITQKANIQQKAGLKFIFKMLQKRKNNFKKLQNTWEVFDCLYLVDLEDIISFHWSELSHIFKDSKQYKNQELPSYGTKEHLITKLSQIRKARNEIFHNKPTKIKFKKDLEIILLRLGYNLEDAIQIGEISSAISLQYKYKNKDF
ncbi:hypothetical protein CAV8706_1416 [Campylobacter avium]|uniref:hypothetical protein n=2 Tax=Campylobacter avium TaxID=522485 RepID=UPI000B953931|nr:hypothetical protein [Campylobacter avium]OYD78421.1 hypothetical protein CAV8706_1416 [Campylobacter avium]